MTCGGAGVVDQYVEPAVAGDDLVDQIVGLASIGDVGLDVAGVGQFGGQGLAGLDRVDELMTTVAPDAANRRAVAAPMPDDEPVTRTIWPRKRLVGRWARTGRVGHGPSVGPGWPRFCPVRLVSMLDGRPAGPAWWSATRWSI